MWNYVESRVIKTFQGHVNKKFSLSGCFGYYGSRNAKHNPPLAFAVSGSEDGAILCWDIVSKNILQRIEGHTDVVIGVHTGKLNGKRMLVSCGLDKTVRVWEETPEGQGQGQNGSGASPVEVVTETVAQNGIATNNDEDGDNEMTDASPDLSTETTPALAEDVMMT
jgi:COMPASS component SWD3